MSITKKLLVVLVSVSLVAAATTALVLVMDTGSDRPEQDGAQRALETEVGVADTSKAEESASADVPLESEGIASALCWTPHSLDEILQLSDVVTVSTATKIDYEQIELRQHARLGTLYTPRAWTTWSIDRVLSGNRAQLPTQPRSVELGGPLKSPSGRTSFVVGTSCTRVVQTGDQVVAFWDIREDGGVDLVVKLPIRNGKLSLQVPQSRPELQSQLESMTVDDLAHLLAQPR